jgi:hypothetical protein
MQAQVLTPFSQQSQAASQVILGHYAFIQGVKNLGSAAIFYLLVIFLSPVLLIAVSYIWFLLRSARKELSKAVDTPILLTSANYSRFRQEYLLLKSLRQKVLAMGLSTLSASDKIALRIFHVSSIVDIFESRITKLETVLSSLNPKPTSSDDVLVPISEDELWHNRTTAYEYLI